MKGVGPIQDLSWVLTHTIGFTPVKEQGTRTESSRLYYRLHSTGGGSGERHTLMLIKCSWTFVMLMIASL
jgi:hypothetical protein